MLNFKTLNFYPKLSLTKRDLTFSTTCRSSYRLAVMSLNKQVQELKLHQTRLMALIQYCTNQVAWGFESQNAIYPPFDKDIIFDDIRRGMSGPDHDRSTYHLHTISLWNAEEIYHEGLMPRSFNINMDSLSEIPFFPWPEYNEKEAHVPKDLCIYQFKPEDLFESTYEQEAWTAYRSDHEETGYWKIKLDNDQPADIGLRWFILNYKPPESITGKRRDEKALAQGRDSETWETWCRGKWRGRKLPKKKPNEPNLEASNPYEKSTFYEQGAAGKWFFKLEAIACKKYYERLIPQLSEVRFAAMIRAATLVYPEYFSSGQYEKYNLFIEKVNHIEETLRELEETTSAGPAKSSKLEKYLQNRMKDAKDLLHAYSQHEDKIFEQLQTPISDKKLHESVPWVKTRKISEIKKGLKENCIDNIFYISDVADAQMCRQLNYDISYLMHNFPGICERLGIPLSDKRGEDLFKVEHWKEIPRVFDHFRHKRMLIYDLIIFNLASTDLHTVRAYIDIAEERISDLTSEWEDKIAGEESDEEMRKRAMNKCTECSAVR